MKRSILLLTAGIFLAMGCSDNKMSKDEKDYANAISDICMEWGADKQRVADYMKDNELKYDGDSVMDYFLSDEDHVVIYNFNDDGLSASVLKVRANTDISMDTVLDGWKYIGSSLEFDEGTNITSMVDIYVKRDKELMATTYTIEHDKVAYRILGFASTKDIER